MNPDEVYVVYDTCYDKIKGVYAYEQLAVDAIKKSDNYASVWCEVLTLSKAIDKMKKALIVTNVTL